MAFHLNDYAIIPSPHIPYEAAASHYRPVTHGHTGHLPIKLVPIYHKNHGRFGSIGETNPRGGEEGDITYLVNHRLPREMKSTEGLRPYEAGTHNPKPNRGIPLQHQGIKTLLSEKGCGVTTNGTTSNNDNVVHSFNS